MHVVYGDRRVQGGPQDIFTATEFGGVGSPGEKKQPTIQKKYFLPSSKEGI
jgi:hypothetical protein